MNNIAELAKDVLFIHNVGMKSVAVKIITDAERKVIDPELNRLSYHILTEFPLFLSYYVSD